MFPRMDMAEEITSLCIEGTNAMLIEMSLGQWSNEEVRVLRGLMGQGIVPIIAHVERYFKFQKQKQFMNEVLGLLLSVQVNAESLRSWRTKKGC